MTQDQRPLVAHIIHKLEVGGLQNGVVNLINHMPADRIRHVIICMTDYTDFAERIQRPDVEVHALHKKEGKDLGVLKRLYTLLRQLKPDLVHTRNLTALEGQLSAFAARIPCRIHGEHGWDSFDPDGTNKKYRLYRKLFRPLVHRYIPMSKHLQAYLSGPIGVPEWKLRQLYNGVDVARFQPDFESNTRLPNGFFSEPENILIGTVGRMHGVKDQVTLTKAFIQLCQQSERAKAHARLVMIGDGPLRGECQTLLDKAHLSDKAWLPGSRNDIPNILQALDVFVLPSTNEGISNTILEAMASGLPVVATDTGGNPELVKNGEHGAIVPVADPQAMATALEHYVVDEDMRLQHAKQARLVAELRFSLEAMMQSYLDVYEELCEERRH